MPRPRWLSPDQERAWRGYRRMRALLDLQLSRDLSRDSGLSEADYDVLSTVSEAPEGRWRANVLADRLLWSTSRLAHQVRRMELRGLVAREECHHDRRGAIVTLTDEGWRVLRRAAVHHVDSVRRHFVDLLTREEIETMTTITDKVIAHLSSATGRR